MHNLEDMIEKYRRELVEFSRQAPLSEIRETSAERAEAAVPTMASLLPFNDAVGGSEEKERYENYEDFVRENPSRGAMKLQVTAGGQSFPIINAQVTVRIPLETGDRDIFTGYTDINGIIDNIELPAPNSDISFDEANKTVVPYSVYEVTVTHPDFANAEFFNVPVFAGIKSIQPVQLVPLTETGSEPGAVNVTNGSMGLYGGDV